MRLLVKIKMVAKKQELLSKVIKILEIQYIAKPLRQSVLDLYDLVFIGFPCITCI